MRVEIDHQAGFCFGVIKAIQKAEEYLEQHPYLFCLGQMVHNEAEVSRLEKKGLRTISRHEYEKLTNETVLLRAHGEAVRTYQQARGNAVSLIDATCPIVLNLQQKIRKCCDENKGQILIFGKKDHPEAVGLQSQCDNQQIVVTTSPDELSLNYQKPVDIFAQTTMDQELYEDFVAQVRAQAEKQVENANIRVHPSLCGHVANRAKQLRVFAGNFDVILFVSGKNSSNGNYLYQVSKAVNPYSYFISDASQIPSHWFIDAESVGISGATSTPQWLLHEVKTVVEKIC
ncbi:MAG: 4-hydroxy-3-methylbut-2-enyl diphosphate reductase [Bacteroidales bacterium]